MTPGPKNRGPKNRGPKDPIKDPRTRDPRTLSLEGCVALQLGVSNNIDPTGLITNLRQSKILPYILPTPLILYAYTCTSDIYVTPLLKTVFIQMILIVHIPRFYVANLYSGTLLNEHP